MRGLYHCVAGGETNWNLYAKYVLGRRPEQAQAAINIKATEVAPVPTSAFPTPATRPHNSRLNTAQAAVHLRSDLAALAGRAWHASLTEIL